MSFENARINYMIGTYDGIVANRERYDSDTGKMLLKHMRILCRCLQTSEHIKQVTLVRNHSPSGHYEEYYDIDEYVSEIEKLGVSVVILCPDDVFASSYSQYLYMYEQCPGFDYYIITEDDWVPYPEQKHFDEQLLKEYQKHNYTGLLTSWVPCHKQMGWHSAITVGIVSDRCLELASRNHKPSLCLSQIAFSRLFEANYDYSANGKNYMIPFWETGDGVIYEFATTLSRKYLFVPMQLLSLDKHRYVLCQNPQDWGNPEPSSDVSEWVEKCNRLKTILHSPTTVGEMEYSPLLKSDYLAYTRLIESDVSRESFDTFIDEVLGPNHHVMVLKVEGELVGTGTLFVEPKLTHGGCKMGHIENILVRPDQRKKGYGEQIVCRLLEKAEENGCYRVDLNCTSELETFYAKNGFNKKHLCMNIYFRENFNQ